MKRTLLKMLGALAVGATLNLQLSTSLAQDAAVALLTITNPSPAVNDRFGYSVAALGTDRVLIGTSGNGAGAAYLFSTNGALLTAFTNPVPAPDDDFGYFVAAVGTDRVLIGAKNDDTDAINAGAAYLFNTNGALLTSFTNPTPAAYDQFGCDGTAVGTSQVLIGAFTDDTGATDAGAAYLFSTNGALLLTYTNPTPAAYDRFGLSVAAVGTGCVLIGATGDNAGASSAGAAYLFRTEGALLTTFTNPVPVSGGSFGRSVAAVGGSHVLIGAYDDGSGRTAVGVAYLFNTNGTLLTPFTNPTPATSDYFGISMAAVGTDRVLIGAYQDDTSAVNSGAAYLFNTNGTLLTPFSNPTPAANDSFGSVVAAGGTNQVLIGAFNDNTGASHAGAAYLFSLGTPSISIAQGPFASTVTVSWPAPTEDWVLEHTNALTSVAVASWRVVQPPYLTNGGTISVIFTSSPATGNQFFRLHK